MRDIRFRMWMLKERQMSDVYNLNDIVTLSPQPTPAEMSNLIFMQFTGIKNTYGHDIYFDDVVAIAGYGNLHVKDVGDIGILLDALPEKDIGGIIGNVHQYPELLKGDEND